MKIGVLGAGQLGRMLALAGYPLERDFHFYDTTGHPSAGLGSVIIDQGGGCDQKLNEFLQKVDRVTYEFENLPHSLTQKIEAQHPIYPSPESIRVCQNRSLEKQLFTDLGIGTANYRIANSAAELRQAVEELGVPVVAKSVTDGYDGKGQAVIRDLSEIDDAWNSINHTQLMVEAFVEFSRELSIIAVRSTEGEIRCYPLAENQHHEGILRYSTAPAPQISESSKNQAEAYIRSILNELNHVGVLALELFETPNGLLANEMAPRVHNSGHWSIEGAQCSQFENHIRAISELPLGDTQVPKPCCMINIIGKKGDLRKLLNLPYVHMHLYGKEERNGRKLGHITVTADCYRELKLRVENIAELLDNSPEYSLTSATPKNEKSPN